MLRPLMVMNPSQPNRRSLRLPEYDYGAAGAYFVTICTRDRISLFGEIDHGTMMLNEFGEIVAVCRSDLPRHFPNIQLDCFIVMLNHIHGLIEITGEFSENSVGAQHAAPVRAVPVYHSTRNVQPGSLGAIVRSFKAASSRRINLLSGTPGATIWQRNYYEHVVRDESELQRVREYIVNNPARWAEDEENPDAFRPAGVQLKA
jgi:REP element-mobilizing transposase RayT